MERLHNEAIALHHKHRASDVSIYGQTMALASLLERYQEEARPWGSVLSVLAYEGHARCLFRDSNGPDTQQMRAALPCLICTVFR